MSANLPLKMATPKISKRSHSDVSTPQISRKSISETSSHPAHKRSTSKMSTGSMLAGSFSHCERRKKVSRVESFDKPSYPDEESKKRALESAIQTEVEFLEFAESLRLPPDNFLPSPIYEESPASILREWKKNEKCQVIQDEAEDKENTSPVRSLPIAETSSSSSMRPKRTSRSPSLSNNNRKKVGLDHLENLVRLMEELSSLREQNIKLQRKLHHIEIDKHAKEHQLFETGIQNDRSMSSIGSFSIQNSPEIAVKTLNKIALNQLEQETDVVLSRSKKLSDVSSPGSRSKSGRILMRSCRLEEEDLQMIDQDEGLQPSNTCPEDLGGAGSKSRSNAWTKVKDVFKRESTDPNVSPGPVRSASMQTSGTKVMLDQIDKTKSMENFSAYLAEVSSSSSSDDNQEIPFSLYNYDLAYDLSVQRSSSFSQVSELQPNLSNSLSLPRRHSMISIGVGDGASLSNSETTTKEEKKVSKSAWGKVKNMIYTRRDSIKKKDLSIEEFPNSSITKKPSSIKRVRPRTTSLSIPKHVDDREDDEYSDPSGIWMGPPDKRHPKDSPRLLARQAPLRDRPASVQANPFFYQSGAKVKPHLTLTLASTEDQALESLAPKEDQLKFDDKFQVKISNPTFAENKLSKTESEHSFQPPPPQAEKSKHANSCSPQAIRSVVTRSEDYARIHNMKNILTSKREADLISNSLSLPNSPLRNSAVFLYEDPPLMQQGMSGEMSSANANYQVCKDSSGSQSSGDWHGLQGEIQKNYEILQRRLSEEFQRKMQVWEKSRTSKDSVFLPSSPMIGRSRSSQSGPGDPVNLELNLSPDFKRKYDEWQKMKLDSSAHIGVPPPPVQQQQQQQQQPQPHLPLENASTSRVDMSGLTPATSKKIRARPLGQQVVQNECDLKPEFRLKVAEWEVRKALAGQGCKNVEEIRKLMPEDFNRKLQEWELIKEGGGATAKGQSSRQDRKASGSSEAVNKKTSTSSWEEKRKSGKFTEALSSHEQDSVWIDKELVKIKREKQRLEMEREKCADKEARLVKIQEALKKGVCYDKEITVKTAKGEEFKFCGISDTFTRKLFEWEERRGIAPESSTIALLNNPVDTREETTAKITNPAIGTLKKEGTIKRSRSEGSIPESVSDEVQLAKSKISSEGNLSQNSPQSISDLDRQARSLKSVAKVNSEESKRHAHHHGSHKSGSGDSSKKKHFVPSALQTLDHHNHTLDLLLHMEQVSDRLQNETYQLQHDNDDRIKILDSVHDLRHTLHTVLKYQASRHRMVSSLAAQTSQHLSVSYSDLSCGEMYNKYAIPSDNETQHSALSSSHSMSRYGSESPVHSMLLSDFKTSEGRKNYDLLDQQERNAIEEASTSSECEDDPDENVNLLGRDMRFCYMGETDEDELDGNVVASSDRTSHISDANNKFLGYRIVTTKRRTSSDNISTPNSGRSRSPSLLSSEYIPEEDDEQILDDESTLLETKKCNQSKSGTSKPAATTNIDQLYQLVHELKEEDLNYHKTLIARKEAAQKALPAKTEDKPVNPPQTGEQHHDIHQHENELGAISKDRDNSLKFKKENFHHKRHQECSEKPVQTGSQPHESHSALTKKHHVRKGSTKKNEPSEKLAVEDQSKPSLKDTSEQERAFLCDDHNNFYCLERQMEDEAEFLEHTPLPLNVFVPTSKTIFTPVSPLESQQSLECSYSVFVLEDLAHDGNNEWEPESDHEDLVCPIASSEPTSMEIMDQEGRGPTQHLSPKCQKQLKPINSRLPDEESGISFTENVKPSEVKKDPNSMPMSKEGQKVAESHAKGKPVSSEHKVTCSSLRSQLERCQKEVKRTISGGNLISKTLKPKEALVHTKSFPISYADSEKKTTANSKYLKQAEIKDHSTTHATELQPKELALLAEQQPKGKEHLIPIEAGQDKNMNSGHFENISKDSLEETTKKLELEPSDSKSDLQSLCQERSKQLMKAKEQFFLGKTGVQRVIVTSMDIPDVKEEARVKDKIEQNLEAERQKVDADIHLDDALESTNLEQESTSLSNVFVRLRKTCTPSIGGENNLSVLPSSVVFRRSLFEPKVSKVENIQLGGSSLLVDALGTRSCPSSPSLNSRTRKKTPFNWHEQK